MFKKVYFSLFLLFICITYASAQRVRGNVYDENGDPLVSATIVIEGTNYSTLTNDEGEFRFRNLPKGTFTIVASFIGYNSKRQEVVITEHSQQTLRYDLQGSNTLSEVEVFGERFKQPAKLDIITRMPLRPSEQIQTISVISEKVIAEQGALTITDALRNVPGVTLFGSYGGVKESMSARGFRGIPVLKNGVRIDSQFQTAAGVADMQGVESIQMIKGSAAVTQGVISDLGNAGGVINVVTKTPKFINAGQVDLRAGSWGQFRPTFDVQSVLNKSKTAAFRINGAYERADNYRPVVSMSRVYINPSFEWRPDGKTVVNLELDYLNENRTPVTSTVNLAADSVEALYDMPHNKFLGFENDNVNTEVTTYSARLNRQLTDNLSIRAAYFGSSYNVDNTSTGLAVSDKKNYNKRQRSLSRNLRDDNNSTFQLDFIGKDVYTGTIKHTFQLGFDYRIAEATTRNLGSVKIDVIDVTANNINNSRQDTTFKNPESVTPAINKYTTYGFMGQEVMTINKYLKAILGVRYSSISTINALATGTSDAGPTIEDAWDPMLGIMITPLKNVNVFGSYTTSTSLRNAGYILNDSITRAGASKTTQFEVGIKSDWLNNRLRFNFTYFNILTDNLANPYYEEGATVASDFFLKAGNLRRDGIEVELNGRVLENLQVMLGYAYLNARYQDSPSFKNGSAPMNAPRHTANAWAQYEVNRGVLKGFSIGAGAYYVGERPVNDFSLQPDGHGSLIGSRPFDMPAFTTVDVQLSYTYGPVTTRVFFNNVFDELGYNSYYRGGYINQIDPRNFSAIVSYQF
ncbi:iron complex outermembrane receptor protein [Dysgonomonas alginatilytica]|uniref:Iron complex outermembrane receptor protein n=1 Tax=Dysgonomonas alginatilytica TaxID=1605892 RepID=A0A2V3PZQ2_9BACT|nr:TonB-dependent receptor [Dysgonomonas alginatilytica]PXV68015.1 iron complex outermembrane receptor protein [Dysgonomonas alginatilytica]